MHRKSFIRTVVTCLLAMATSLTPAAIATEPDAVAQAHAFELTYRAHPSVSQDPFYEIPENVSDTVPGNLLKVERETNTSLYTLAPNLSMSRFVSKTSNGTIVFVSAYILWPYVARDCGDGLPMVVWAHGTSGTNDECAPSNMQNLWHHFQAPYQLALLGYVVVATDYAGLGIAETLRADLSRTDTSIESCRPVTLRIRSPLLEKSFLNHQLASLSLDPPRADRRHEHSPRSSFRSLWADTWGPLHIFREHVCWNCWRRWL